MKKLNLGCGNNYMEGWTNLDLNIDIYGCKSKLDISHDLNEYPYPLKENEFEVIRSWGLLEHIKDLDSHIKELTKVSKINCKMEVHVPYFLSYTTGKELPIHRFGLNCVQLFAIFEKYGWRLKSKKLNISYNKYLSWLNGIVNYCGFTKNLLERFPIIIPEGIDWVFKLNEKKERNEKT